MRNRLLRVAFVAAGLTPFVVASVLAQEPPSRRGAAGRGCPGRRAEWTRRRAGAAGRTWTRRSPAKPAPRGANGRALLGSATPTEKGVWLPGNGGAQAMVDDLEKVPFQPWAKALLAERRRNQLEPHTRCKPSGFVRQFLTPYGVEIVELAEIQRVYIFDIGGPHTYRTILHRRPDASRESRAQFLRPLDRLVGRRHAGRRYRPGSTRASGWTAAVCRTRKNFGRWSASRAPIPTRSRYEVTVDDPGHLHGALDERVQAAGGKRAPSCSNTSARKPTTPTPSWSATRRRSTAPARSSPDRFATV